MNGAAVADYRHVVGEDDFADDRDGAADEDANVARPKNFESSDAAEGWRRQDASASLAAVPHTAATSTGMPSLIRSQHSDSPDSDTSRQPVRRQHLAASLTARLGLFALKQHTEGLERAYRHELEVEEAGRRERHCAHDSLGFIDGFGAH